MIIFFNKHTGQIIGNIGGRNHARHLDMWMGDPNETDRLIVEWKPTGEVREEVEERIEYESVGVDEEGEDIYKKVSKKEVRKIKELEPYHKQKQLFIDLEENPTAWHNYKVDLKTKELIPNG